MTVKLRTSVRTSQPRRIRWPAGPRRLAMASATKFDKRIRPTIHQATHKRVQSDRMPISPMRPMVAGRVVWCQRLRCPAFVRRSKDGGRARRPAPTFPLVSVSAESGSRGRMCCSQSCSSVHVSRCCWSGSMGGSPALCKARPAHRTGSRSLHLCSQGALRSRRR